MKLATLRRPGAPDQTFAAVVHGDAAIELAGFADVGAFLAASPEAREAALKEARDDSFDSAVPLAEATFATLVPAPSKVFCIGLNYRNHIAETGNEIPRYPTVFTKFADSLTGSHDAIEIPDEDHRIDWEGELAIVIGEPGRRIAEADAPRHIAGFAVSNDVSMRGWQGRTKEWTQGKAWEATTPVGPYLVTLEIVGQQFAGQLREGVVSQLDVFESERSLLAAQLALLANHQQLLSDTVTLYKAMGGGWPAVVVSGAAR